MKNNKELEELYILSCEKKNSIHSANIGVETNLLEILFEISLTNNNNIYHENNYNLDAIANLFRFYEEELKNSFNEDKNRFSVLFNIYLLAIELFTSLCIIFSTDKEKRTLINPIIQTLKESENMIKFFIPFEENELNVLNNLIGEQLYYFSHIQYVHTKDKTLDYIFEEYFLYCERMNDGFELSESTSFGNNPNKSLEEEKMIFINNLSFLLLKMLYKLAFYRANEEYTNNNYFLNIKKIFKDVSFLNKESNINTKKEIETALLQEFKNSATFLKNRKNLDMWDEKIKLLVLNTDEYKELIDIITSSK